MSLPLKGRKEVLLHSNNAFHMSLFHSLANVNFFFPVFNSFMWMFDLHLFLLFKESVQAKAFPMSTT